jgi:hypothetical protein
MATPTLPAPGTAADDTVVGRNETPLERCDRNLTELLAEVRVVQTGVQVLLAFLLVAPLNARFGDLTSFQRLVFFLTLVTTATAAVLLIAPTAHHRILFRCGDKEHLLAVANRCTLLGLAFVAASMAGALLLVTDLLFGPVVAGATTALAAGACARGWGVVPLRRRRAVRAGR